MTDEICSPICDNEIIRPNRINHILIKGDGFQTKIVSDRYLKDGTWEITIGVDEIEELQLAVDSAIFLTKKDIEHHHKEENKLLHIYSRGKLEAYEEFDVLLSKTFPKKGSLG